MNIWIYYTKQQLSLNEGLKQQQQQQQKTTLKAFNFVGLFYRNVKGGGSRNDCLHRESNAMDMGIRSTSYHGRFCCQVPLLYLRDTCSSVTQECWYTGVCSRHFESDIHRYLVTKTNKYWVRMSVISWIIKTEVCVICRSRRHEVLIIHDIMRNRIQYLFYYTSASSETVTKRSAILYLRRTLQGAW